MENIFIGIGGYSVSNAPDKQIKTMALGSCVGIMIYEPQRKIAGMVHIALPDSSIGAERAKQLPGYFADTGIDVLLKEFQKLGIANGRTLKVKIAGGASIMDAGNFFNIGKRNILSVRKHLWKRRLAVTSEDVGGNYSRTSWIEVGTGRVMLSSPGKGVWEI